MQRTLNATSAKTGRRHIQLIHTAVMDIHINTHTVIHTNKTDD